MIQILNKKEYQKIDLINQEIKNIKVRIKKLEFEKSDIVYRLFFCSKEDFEYDEEINELYRELGSKESRLNLILC